jgi:hypothetical protein
MNEIREPGANLPPAPFLARTSQPGSGNELREQDDRNPLLRGLVWWLVAIGVLGSGIWAAQKYLFNNNDDKPERISESQRAPTAPQKPASVPPVTERSNPLPSAAPQQSVLTLTVQRQNADSGRRMDTPPPSVGHTVAFVTDPPGATVTVDMQSALSCRTPCMLTLTAGRHALKAQMDGYRDYPKIITVPQDDDFFMKLNPALGSLILP